MEQTCVSQRHNCPLPSCSAINTTIYSSLSSSSFSSSSSSSSSSSNFLFLSVHLSVRFSSKAQTSISVTISVSALEILQTSLQVCIQILLRVRCCCCWSRMMHLIAKIDSDLRQDLSYHFVHLRLFIVGFERIIDRVIHHLLLAVHDLTLLLKLEENPLHGDRVDLGIHALHGFRRSFHGFCHGLRRFDGLKSKANSLHLTFHLIELRDLSSCSD
mmetsp:Transcript_38504/g.121331  ORF Transcript_38504/g.121331 Transcript_38504/m.121331 type:complete len:215 (-) Transcript_38504:240-884(-)